MIYFIIKCTIEAMLSTMPASSSTGTAAGGKREERTPGCNQRIRLILKLLQCSSYKLHVCSYITMQLLFKILKLKNKHL